MTAGLPIRSTPVACRIGTASPILLHPCLITVFRVYKHREAMKTVLSWLEYRIWQELKWNQTLGIHNGSTFQVATPLPGA